MAFWLGHGGELDPEMVPQSAPKGKQVFPLPWERYATLKNVQRVARWWCGGDCDKARRLPPALFCEVLAAALAEEKGKAIADENAEKEAERVARLNANAAASRS